MTSEEIIKGNKLIADFMNVKIGEDLYSWRPGCTEPLQEKHLNYHSSWDWLMSVFERIQYINDNNSEFFEEYYNIDFKIDLLNGVDFKVDKKRIFMQTALGPGQLIEALWEGILEFIKWFNQNNDKTKASTKTTV